MLDLNIIKNKFKKLNENQSFKFYTNKLRPKNFDEYIGNSAAKEIVQATILATKKEGTPFPHTLLSGYSGSGKTSLAMLIASYQQGKVLSAAMPIDYEEWYNLCKQICLMDVLICDEVQLMKKQPEILYSVLEENTFVTKDGQRLTVEPFTAVGCTTEIGEIKTPLRNRFSLHIQLAKLTLEDMRKITVQGAAKYNIPITDEAVTMLAQASCSIPRDCNSLLTRAFDVANVYDKNSIDEEIVEETFRLLQVTKDGMNITHIRYLDLLHKVFKNERVGLSTLAATLGENSLTLSQIIEPPLLNSGRVIRTSRGRQISDKGREYLESKEVKQLKEKE